MVSVYITIPSETLFVGRPVDISFKVVQNIGEVTHEHQRNLPPVARQLVFPL